MASMATCAHPAAKKLSERDAWAIALSWRDQLQGCVRLETDPSDTLVPVFSWVSFVLNGSLTDGLREIKDTRDTATCARAATLAWFALSCCTGFGARENPHFWRRVFSEFHAVPASSTHHSTSKKPTPYRPQRPISDAVRFFDGVFPRARLVAKYPQDGTSVRAFLVASETVDRKLLKALKRLTPFIHPFLWNRRTVPVAIEGLDIDELIKVIKHAPDKSPSPALPNLSLPCPTFELRTVLLRRQDTRSARAIRDLQALRSKAQIVIDECEFAHLFHTQRGVVESLLQNDESSLFTIRTLSLARSIGSRTKMAVACSSLPFMHSLAAVELTSTRFEVKAEGLDEWAWLGYAVFHPAATGTTSSAFSRLDLRLPYVRDIVRHVQAFARMATGNHLLQILGDETAAATTSSTYHQARLRAGSTIRLDAVDGDSVEMETGGSDLWCTLCVDIEEVSDEWVRAVVPGHGLAWMQQTDILETSVAPPGKSCVRRLRLELASITNEDNELLPRVTAPMLALLSVIGPELKSLDLGDSLSVGIPIVRAVLERCPSLETLRISHDGTFWRDEISPELDQCPRLKELELWVDASPGSTLGLQPLRSCSLRELRTLRIRTTQHESFEETHRNFLTALATFPGIIHGHWHYSGVAPFATYEKRRLHSLSLQRQMDCGQRDVSQVPMRLDCKLAFLSIVRRMESQSVLWAVGPDLLRNVFSFSTSPELRTVYIGRD